MMTEPVLTINWYLIAREDEPALSPLGLWERRQANHLKLRCRTRYCALLYDGRPNTHLSHIDQQAQQMADQLTAQLIQTEGVTKSIRAAEPVRLQPQEDG